MKVNAVGKDIIEADRAYTAGFLDADGAIMATIERHTEKKFGYRVRVTIKITQKDEAVLKWFVKNFKMGKIRQNRTTFDWLIRDKTEALELLEIVTKYLKVKKSQAKLAKTIMQKEIKTKDDLLEVAQLADSLSRFNVRSKNRRINYASMI